MASIMLGYGSRICCVRKPVDRLRDHSSLGTAPAPMRWRARFLLLVFLGLGGGVGVAHPLAHTPPPPLPPPAAGAGRRRAGKRRRVLRGPLRDRGAPRRRLLPERRHRLSIVD